MKKIFSLKWVSVLLALALIFAFSSCSSDDDDDDEDTSSSTTASAYLPDEFSSKTIAALYTKSESDSGTDEDTGVAYTYSDVEAYYFFTDYAWVKTTQTVITSAGQTKTVNDLGYKGTYTLAGNYTDGTLVLNKTHQGKDNEWQAESESAWRTFTVSNGSFIHKDETYTKQ